MYSSTLTLLSALGLASAAAVPKAPEISKRADCVCNRNDDAGRWTDSESPAYRLQTLIVQDGGGCAYTDASQKMCVSGDVHNWGECAIQYAQEQQSQHGDWFLWSSISCGGGSDVLTITIGTTN
ncbi:hypothetical protein DOTSEDRAFT_37163 [Dothistroma septosporum NZE10]|uniref:Uncharacterized protein n=1 Tax=Dothistroma septosporum (strain NZE10 / CBS 128990) TaxID=675120 RepID=N1PJW9_DOTSN|nr:hypothetical protein DOTSEDRAFT_37163 [Dothistroma septosporum NZE10]